MFVNFMSGRLFRQFHVRQIQMPGHFDDSPFSCPFIFRAPVYWLIDLLLYLLTIDR